MAKAKGQVATYQKKAPPRTLEERWQREVVAHLRTALPGAVVAHAANERTASKEQGLVPGYPDLVIHWRGVTFAIELKAGANRLRAAQRKCHGQLAANGVAVWTLREGDRASLAAIIPWALGWRDHLSVTGWDRMPGLKTHGDGSPVELPRSGC